MRAIVMVALMMVMLVTASNNYSNTNHRNVDTNWSVLTWQLRQVLEVRGRGENALGFRV